MASCNPHHKLQSLQEIGRWRKFHWFRHSQATNLGHKLGESKALNDYFGWSQNSDMPSRYVHPDINLVKKELEKIYPQTKNEMVDVKKAQALRWLKEMLSEKEVLIALFKAAREKGNLPELRQEILPFFELFYSPAGEI